MHDRDDGHVGEERERVEEKEGGEAARAAQVRDEAAGDPAQPDPEVHRQALLGKGGVPADAGGEPRDEGRLARPETGRAGALEREQKERLPGVADEGEGADAGRLQDEPAGERRAGPDAVDHGACQHSRHELGRGRRGDDEPRGPEREAANVVQVEDEEREHDAVPERVDDPAALEEPDIPRQLRIEPTQRGERSHRANLPRRGTPQRTRAGTKARTPAQDAGRSGRCLRETALRTHGGR